MSVIAAIPGASTALAAKRSTSTIPIVFLTAGDAVELGLVTSLNKPDGNLTGVSGLINSLVTKQFGLLGELLTKTVSFATHKPHQSEHQCTGEVCKQRREAVGGIRSEHRHEGELMQLQHYQFAISVALSFRPVRFLAPDASESSHSRQLSHPRSMMREFVEAGGVISHGSTCPVYRQLGVYTGKILRAQTCRFAGLPAIEIRTWWSIARRQKGLAWKCRPRCNCSPTR